MYRARIFLTSTVCALLLCAGALWPIAPRALAGRAIQAPRQVLTVHQVLRLCDRKPNTRARVRVRGYFVETLVSMARGPGGFGRLYDKKVPNEPGVRVGDSTPYLPARWFRDGDSWIPSAHWVMVSGRLACSDPGYVTVVFVEKWKSWVKRN